MQCWCKKNLNHSSGYKWHASLTLNMSKISPSHLHLAAKLGSSSWWSLHVTVKSFGIKLSHLLPSQNNFLQAFPSVPMPKAGGVKAASAGSGSLLGLWLRLLVNLSFAEDGQQSILRMAGALELLADLAQHRRHALLTLHNLCFCHANKPHVIANGMKGENWRS